MRFTARALIAVGLLVGFYVLVLAVFAGLATATVLLARSGLSARFNGILVITLFALGFAVAVGRALFFRPRDEGPRPGLAVTEIDQPTLWREVATLADEVGTRAPDEIRLIASVNAAVTQDSRFLGLLPGRRTLYVGVPLLLSLGPLEIRSVLAHELGHYSARHMALGPVTYRGREAIGQVMVEVGPESVLGRMIGVYGRLYLAVSHSVSRRQELEADAFSARLAGPDAAASALRMLTPLGAAWHRFTREYATLGEDLGLRPDRLLEGFAAMLEDPAVLHQLVDLADQDLDATRSIYDTHPPLAERVARLEALPNRSAPRPGEHLLIHQSETLAAFERDAFEDSDLRPATWPEAVAAGGASRARQNRHVLGKLAGSESTLDSFTTRISHRGPVGLLEGYPPADERRILAGLMGDAVADVLVQRGSATFTLNWAGPARLTDNDGTDIDLSGSLRPLAESGDSAPLRAQLSDLGVDMSEALPIAEDQVPKRTVPSVLGAIGTVGAGPTSVLVIVPDGMLLVHLTVRERAAFLARSMLGASASRRANEIAVEKVLALSLEAMRTGDSRFYAWDAITSAGVADGRWVSKMMVRLRDGEKCTMSFNGLSEIAGDPWGAIEHHLGDRWIVR
ncbi:MAG: M48 family metallopeptidase [Propionibacteriales bacterium]|nr:M48 family metallopeptidase [Propionibacteriales bacterium]